MSEIIIEEEEYPWGKVVVSIKKEVLDVLARVDDETINSIKTRLGKEDIEEVAKYIIDNNLIDISSPPNPSLLKKRGLEKAITACLKKEDLKSQPAEDLKSRRRQLTIQHNVGNV